MQVSSEAAKAFEAFWREHREARLAGRDKILGRFCPQIHGMLTVKLAAVLMLIGGLQTESDSGTRMRGEIHMLLIGDPGTGMGSVSSGSSIGCKSFPRFPYKSAVQVLGDVTRKVIPR